LSRKAPFKIAWYAAFESKELALTFEKYLKSSSGSAFRNKRLLQNLDESTPHTEA